MGRAASDNWVRSVGLAALAAAARQVVIGGQTRYRWNPSLMAVPGWDRWYTVWWAPLLEAHGNTGADAFAASIGAAVRMTTFQCCLWPVLVGGTTMPDGAALSAANAIVLNPGMAVDLGGWLGDLILGEDPTVQGPGAFNWTNGALAPLLGDGCFGMAIDPLLSLGPRAQRVSVDLL